MLFSKSLLIYNELGMYDVKPLFLEPKFFLVYKETSIE
jgi:hypothetical protein